MSLKQRINEDVKNAMRAGEKYRLGILRLVTSAIKQLEVDTRLELDDDQVLAVLDKMVKQRRESIAQFEKAARQDLADKEAAEIVIIQDYLPEALSEAEISELIDAAMAETGASGMRDMGKVMGLLKPQMQGRADMGAVSGLIKAKLAG